MVNFSSLDDHERPDEVLLSVPFDKARHCASNGRIMVDFGLHLEVVFDGYVGKYYVTLPHSSSQTKP